MCGFYVHGQTSQWRVLFSLSWLLLGSKEQFVLRAYDPENNFFHRDSSSPHPLSPQSFMDHLKEH